MLYQDQIASMIKDQLIRRGIKNKKVLDAMGKTPRHQFIPEQFSAKAYGDHPLPIGFGQTISQPYIVALMTELADIRQSDKVLEIGTGSGYQSAVLSHLSDHVFSVERNESLADAARLRLNNLGYQTIQVRCGDGTMGLKANAPFDCIIVTAAAPSIPENLKYQLNDNGRLIIPVGLRLSQTLIKLTRQGAVFSQEASIDCAFVPLVGQQGWSENLL